jgi:hypothetical protein
LAQRRKRAQVRRINTAGKKRMAVMPIWYLGRPMV